MSSAPSRRRYPRQLRRLAVRFWRQGEDRARQAATRGINAGTWTAWMNQGKWLRLGYSSHQSKTYFSVRGKVVDAVKGPRPMSAFR